MALFYVHFFHRFYYGAKPFIPRNIRMFLRRQRAQAVLKSSGDIWPINRTTCKKPNGWPGWPQKKQFAFVLTHDVESQKGIDRLQKLAELEMELGFRSSFNLIPEGEYKVSKELRDWLTENGFEVGVHDLHHNGKLYNSRRSFLKKANRINHYLKEWGAVGFRAGFMLRELDWHHDLDILYDLSTFDTDPFEPQPEGTGTIFPFRINRTESGRENKYIELSYTLAQDSTLFLILKEQTPATWIEKLDWLAQEGGMALVNVHPDYIATPKSNLGAYEYPLNHYRELLHYVKEQYRDQYWHALPHEVASYAAKVLPD